MPLGRDEATASQLFRLALCMVAFAPMVLRSSRALAEPAPRLELGWEAPLECPTLTQVRAQVEALTERDAGDAGPLRASARVTHQEDGGWVLHLQLVSGESVDERELVGDSCQALVDAVAVVLALQLSPTEKPAPAPAEPKPTAPEPSKPRQPAPVVPTRRSWLQLGVAGSADSAALPRFALGAHAELGWALERFYLGIGAGVWPRQEQALGQGSGGRARFGWQALSLSACHGTWGHSVRLGPCLAGELGELSAQSLDIRAPSETRELWLAVVAGVAFWVPLGSHLVFTSGLSAAVPLSRPRFVVEGVGQIHQPRVLGVRSSLGLAARF